MRPKVDGDEMDVEVFSDLLAKRLADRDQGGTKIHGSKYHRKQTQNTRFLLISISIAQCEFKTVPTMAREPATSYEVEQRKVISFLVLLGNFSHVTDCRRQRRNGHERYIHRFSWPLPGRRQFMESGKIQKGAHKHPIS